LNGPAVDQILADESVSSLTSPGSVIWPLADHLGTPRDLVTYDDATGQTTLVNHRYFDSFGNLISETNGSFDILFGFTAGPLDDATGFTYRLHRWYVSQQGVWVSEDPISFLGGDPNLRRYVGNSPTNFVDPSGLEGTLPQFMHDQFERLMPLPPASSPAATPTIDDLARQGMRTDGRGRTVPYAPNRQPKPDVDAWLQAAGQADKNLRDAVNQIRGRPCLGPMSPAQIRERDAAILQAHIRHREELGAALMLGSIDALPGIGGGRGAFGGPWTNAGSQSFARRHGNSRVSRRPQHTYEIFETTSGDVVKNGLSGQPLNQNGTSPRANTQVSKFNRLEGASTYDARVTASGIPGRQKGLECEADQSQQLRDAGNSMSKHQRP
jgi:RHS repeat-associated protein